jgi:hypothetical protein
VTQDLGPNYQCDLLPDMQAQLQVVTWGDSQQRPRVLLHSDTSPGALFNFETALKVCCLSAYTLVIGVQALTTCATAV